MSYEPIFRLPSSSIVDALAFSPRLDWLASGDQKGFVKIYETVTGMERHVFEFDDPVTSLTWHPKENTIFVGLGSGVVAFIHDFKNLGRQVASGVKGAEVYTISFSSSGRKLGMGIGQEVHIATPTTDRGYATTTIFPQPLEDSKTGDARIRSRGIHFIESEKQMIVSYLNHGVICWDIYTRSPIWTIAHSHVPGFIGHSHVSSDERFICINNLATGFDVYNIKSRTLVRSLQVPSHRERNVPLVSCFLRDRNVVITASHDGEARVWHVGSGMLMQKLPTASSSSIRFICAGNFRSRGFIAIAPSSKDSGVSVWKELSAPRGALSDIASTEVIVGLCVVLLLAIVCILVWHPALIPEDWKSLAEVLFRWKKTAYSMGLESVRRGRKLGAWIAQVLGIAKRNKRRFIRLPEL
ncbi:hypothetical protein CC1G_06907 [Coprinopsis cinerea okayama7|uniref:WD40 repeat-like protein n=1 Tax=Coprinopsis cinerea (strain Okayama-7 / 130 / ATCC MYA-4618 / FGSC 9003) TaxID=240176 RepID=A8NZL7_COPC7|nr:hypothetical protein CC1G_06907 [Coprinopsis cinerea okayama7\|eukprot:XP_001837701.2 hypothetical protein CC1G_06907 [Coprinopsis cinerea okayama7\